MEASVVRVTRANCPVTNLVANRADWERGSSETLSIAKVSASQGGDEVGMATSDKVIVARRKARAAKRRWLIVVIVAAAFWVRPLRSLQQNSAVPTLGPHPLEQTNGQGNRVEFEVASVRLNEKWKFADPGYSLDSDDNYVPGENLFVADGPLSTFIGFAYKLDLLNSMIANLPKWANEQSYEIRARVPGNPSKDQVRLMMRALLIERFQLAIHFEKQEKPALALTLIKPGSSVRACIGMIRVRSAK
jgi:hypothetical protein